MRTHTLERCQYLPRPKEEVFAFFSHARNLERITPAWLHFRILDQPDRPLRAGDTIDYALRVRGLPLRWRSRIRRWDPPFAFVDEQLRGPYRRWVHTHRFESIEGGTRVLDHVEYAVPGGALVERLFVRRDLEAIFDHRARVLARRFRAPELTAR